MIGLFKPISFFVIGFITFNNLISIAVLPRFLFLISFTNLIQASSDSLSAFILNVADLIAAE
jgi:hypothetical protein